MKTIPIEIPEGKRAEWVNGVLTLVDEQPVEFKYKVGDKVRLATDQPFYDYDGKEFFIKAGNEVKIKECFCSNNYPAYEVVYNNSLSSDLLEKTLKPCTEQPKDITERIKCLEDARQWCNHNGKSELVCDLDFVSDCFDGLNDETRRDILAYLKLRIITAALNEGWEPTFEEEEDRCYIHYNPLFNRLVADKSRCLIFYYMAATLYFKSPKLASYAATQFKDIYMDFCYKGKE